ncbi:hypothetical protein [Streptomyces cylindrosporus]|uniref:Lipoprotein n=1 Tax=Streptomyces cylindrosporus TaxID=2927583 RepID=A0ABS9YNC7_9ACTN|nr:hypothetical protein [Streptomyces cylindrosporus]MCI3278773.1 hypothetical protein [Streptomyces cylindrosporus]
MHRTTTTATLLVTVAVSALSGCVTVQRPPVPAGPVPAAPSQPSAPRPDGQSEPQIVQAPAREALEMMGPSKSAGPRKPERHGPTADAQTPADPHPAPRSHPHPHPHPRKPHPQPRHQSQPNIEIPDVTKSVPKSQSDVCALGKKYGGWKADSPESVICKQAHGR